MARKMSLTCVATWHDREPSSVFRPAVSSADWTENCGGPANASQQRKHSSSEPQEAYCVESQALAVFCLAAVTSCFRKIYIIYPRRRQSRGAVFTAVCLLFPYDISKTDAARITKLDKEMFHHESRKFIYFGIKRSNFKVTRRKNCQRGSLHSCECWLLLVLFPFSSRSTGLLLFQFHSSYNFNPSSYIG